ncbi:NAD-binding protein [Patescibacteria group bacterium]|nr:NAD-binding protein [Patescibacteria group bacterium]
MNIVVIGTGYVGLVQGTCLAKLGHKVTCVDINEDKINQLQLGIVPFFEPGLSDLVKEGASQNKLFFSSS